MSFKLFLLLSLCLPYTLAAVASACCLYKFLKYFRCFRCRWRSQTQCHGTCYLGLQRASANWIKLRKASAACSPASFYVAYFAAPSSTSTSASAYTFIQLNLKEGERERHFHLPETTHLAVELNGKVLKTCHIHKWCNTNCKVLSSLKYNFKVFVYFFQILLLFHLNCNMFGILLRNPNVVIKRRGFHPVHNSFICKLT